MKIYKIKNPQGLFSTGGATPMWTSKGKSWSSIGYIKSHLTGLRSSEYYENCNIVEYEMIETTLMPAIEFINQNK